MVNESSINPTGTPVRYKLVPHYSQMLLADPSSYHTKRSEFGEHAVWVTRYADDELYPSGYHTTQSPGDEGIATWMKNRKTNPDASTSVQNEDIVIWHTSRDDPQPRSEDWPIMPSEKMLVGLKPLNFFERNPALDLPISNQEQNKSVCCS